MTYTAPSLRRVEMKFMLDAALSEQVRQWAIDRLGVDENCAGDGSNSYDINTLYLDTPESDMYYQTGVIGKAKHRVRRYGRDQMLVLETKRKKKMVVRKNRTAVFESDFMARAANPMQPKIACEPNADDADLWCGDWFINRIADRRLTPAIQIAYRRFARTTTVNDENLRLTIDSNMAACAPNGWNVATPRHDASSALNRGFRSIGDFEILELKFQNQMPTIFKELLSSFPIPGTKFSKFRTGMEQKLTGVNRSHVDTGPITEPQITEPHAAAPHVEGPHAGVAMPSFNQGHRTEHMTNA